MCDLGLEQLSVKLALEINPLFPEKKESDG